MRHLKRLVFLAILMVGLSASSAYAVSIRDLLELKNAGLSDDVLIALIETDGSVFRLGVSDVRWLKEQGLSERVIVAMLLTRKPEIAAQQQQAEASPAPVERVVERSAPAPVYVTQTQHVTQQVVQEVERPVYVPVYVPVETRRPEPVKPAEPTYWGWGGKQRPDSWGYVKPEEKPAPKPEPPVIKK
jgi:hypothetical protein